MSAASILVLDDNPTNLKLVSDILLYEGYNVSEAMDAEKAQQLIDAQPFDLVLLDIALPGMDGLTFTRKLRADSKTRSLMIVALTAFAMTGDEQRARDAGCDAYITKPIDTRRFPGQVADFLKQKRQQPVSRIGMKILVIEDTPSERKLAQLVLTGAGHEVSGVEAAEQALVQVKQDPPDLILLDLHLPGLDGIAFARLLKSDPATRDILIVALTSFPERFPKAEALAAGCDAYLVKPFNTRELPAQIREVAHSGGPLPAPREEP